MMAMHFSRNTYSLRDVGLKFWDGESNGKVYMPVLLSPHKATRINMGHSFVQLYFYNLTSTQRLMYMVIMQIDIRSSSTQ